MSFNPDGPVGTQLKANLIQELKNRFNCADDAVDIAEFIVILIASGKLHHEIVGEVKEIADIPIDVPFVETVYREIERLEQEHKAQSQIPTHDQNQHEIQPNLTVNDQQQQQQQPNNEVHQQQSSQPNPFPQPTQNFQENTQYPPSSAEGMPPVPTAFPDSFPADFNGNAFPGPAGGAAASSLPSGPKLLRKAPVGPRGRGGIQKDKGNKPKSFALKNAANFAKAVGPTGALPFVQKPSKGRCQDFPYCNNKECELAHPTKNCFSYPNCPNPPGTCNYLHPDEDQELIAKLAKSREEFAERKKKEVQIQLATCKFGPKCTKDTCPFAHPTPANSAASILTLEWCPQGKGCINTECGFAHPPPPTAKPLSMQDQAEIALEQCKFGTGCTNPKCPRRHATLRVLCRGGSECRRLDCFFSHPLKEDCRFGKQCQNKNCLYQHPEGREISSNTWSNDKSNTWQATSEKSGRSFAEDQAMEQVVQQ